ncbi:partial [Paramuricea clavata]|uniref:Partial n=1 Tax=Paramuricea clavata TaxID=317549 RepID=A0A6S7FTV8_PARCT|nr:partial [Paramuricea clavata]
MLLVEDENKNKSSELANHGEATELDKTTKASEQSSESACRKELLVEDTYYESSKPADHGKDDELSNTWKAPVMHNTEADLSRLEGLIKDLMRLIHDKLPQQFVAIVTADQPAGLDHNLSIEMAEIEREDGKQSRKPGPVSTSNKYETLEDEIIDVDEVANEIGEATNDIISEHNKETESLNKPNIKQHNPVKSSTVVTGDSLLKVDIFTINETRLDESISDEEVNIEGYNLYRKDRCRSGGGVAIYTRDVLNAREMSQFVPKDIEAVCLEIVKHKTKPMLVTSIYHPPNSKADFMDALENYFHLLDEQGKELIITVTEVLGLASERSRPVMGSVQTHIQLLSDIYAPVKTRKSGPSGAVFGAVQSAGGFNNNPTAQQFTAAYKRPLMRSTIEGGKGNCQKLDPTSILHIIDDTCNVNEEDVSITNAQIIRKYDLEAGVQNNSSVQEHNSGFPPTVSKSFRV